MEDPHHIAYDSRHMHRKLFAFCRACLQKESDSYPSACRLESGDEERRLGISISVLSAGIMFTAHIPSCKASFTELASETFSRYI